MADNPSIIEAVPTSPDAPDDRRRFTPERLDGLADHLREELDDAESSRFGRDVTWRECLRMYHGQPEHPVRDVPIPNAPNIEIPLGATAADAIYAQSIDTIWQVSPVVTTRALDGRFVKHAKALQRLINWGVANEWCLRDAINHSTLDSTQLGTGIYYIPWLETRRKTMTQTKLVSASPKIRSLAIEDFFVPGSACPSAHDSRWAATRTRYTPTQLTTRAALQGWDIDGVQTTGDTSLVRERRENQHRDRPSGEAMRELVEVFSVFIDYDIDGDGLAENLMVDYEKAGNKILRAVYNPFDRCRPFESFVYQPKPHFFYGIGVIEMLKELERAVTDVSNYWLLNMLLANTRVWAVKEGVFQEGSEIWPNKQIATPNPDSDIRALQMADVYQSAPQAVGILTQFAERRSGVSDIAQGRGASLGSRTPGITALSAMQNVNQRFTPAFDNLRLATAAAVRQCLYRYQERLMMDDRAVQDKLRRLLGPEDGQLVIEVLSRPDFDNSFEIELTASSASINREADRQNAMLLLQFLGQYYSKPDELDPSHLDPWHPGTDALGGNKDRGCCCRSRRQSCSHL